MNEYALPENWRWIELEKVCDINPSKREISHLPGDLEVSFIPMAYVNETNRIIERQDKRKLKEVKKGYTYFRENDILFAKITPCMENGKFVIARNLINGIGFGTTEFHVLRPKENILPEYIRYYMIQKSFREIAQKNMTGTAGQQRVPEAFFHKIKIPMPYRNGKPDEAIQREIVNKLGFISSKILEAIKIRQGAVEEKDKIMFSALNSILGKADEKDWRKIPIGEVCKLINGKAFKPRDWSDHGLPIIRIQNLNDSTKPYNYFNGKVDNKFYVNTGDVLISWSGTPGTSFGAHIWIGEKAILNQHIFRVELNETIVRKSFFVYSINYILQELISKAHGGVGLRHITKKKLESSKITIPVKDGKPNLNFQERIVENIDKLQRKVDFLTIKQNENMRELKALEYAALHKAFRGELTS